MTTTRPKKKARTAITRSGGYSHQVASARPAPALLRFLLLSLCVSLCALFLELAPASASPANDKAYALIFGTVWTPDAWDRIERGEIGGQSMQGKARRAKPSAEKIAALRS